MNLDSFTEKEEKKVADDFLEKGFIIFPLDQTNESTIDILREVIFNFAKQHLKLAPTVASEDFFDHTEKYLSVAQLNELKLKLIALTSENFKFHSSIYKMAKKYLDYIVGNEVCMQRSLNLSIQLPHDESALLPLHTDVWSGNSPYEVVFWMPLVNCYKSKSMYVLPLQESRKVFTHFSEYQKMDAEELYQSLKKDVVFVDVPKGCGVLFSHSILHGNRLNLEPETRWTYNIRFKSVLSPFGTKSLGETFIPITLKPATRIGYGNIIPQII